MTPQATDHPDHHHRRRRRPGTRFSTPTTGPPTCATRCGSARPSPPPAPNMPRSSKSARTRCSPTPSPTPSAENPPPQHPHAAPRHPRHPDLPHQPQRHPHHPPTPHRPPPRTPPRAAHHPLAPHPPLDHHQRDRPPRWATHPLLGIGVTDPTNGTRVWESALGPDVLWLGDHRVDDACVLPGAAYAELALAAATDTFGAEATSPGPSGSSAWIR